ncbi:MerR family transcriptional regulator [Nonomuraea sp. NPDC049709]|uniref:MerR family transcriptional regulator n=1 Tax=Nonomuraea sp. NPDC049709 TaxID=3154736 RepID=UPI0034163219
MKQDIVLQSGSDRPYLRSGQVAERTGVNLQTLRCYERCGLIAEPARSSGEHRAYPPETVTLLTVIKAAQRLGFTLEEVAELLGSSRRCGVPMLSGTIPHIPRAGDVR